MIYADLVQSLIDVLFLNAESTIAASAVMLAVIAFAVKD